MEGVSNRNKDPYSNNYAREYNNINDNDGAEKTNRNSYQNSNDQYNRTNANRQGGSRGGYNTNKYDDGRRHDDVTNNNYDNRDYNAANRTGITHTPAGRKPRRKKSDDIMADVIYRKLYEHSELDDVLQDKIATQLRENGIAETKVIPLSAKITQAVRDDVIDANQTGSPQVTANLTEAINKHLDPILFNRPNATDLRNSQRPSDAQHLSNLILLRMGQVHEEIELCKISVEDPRNKKNKGYTPREDLPDRSMLMGIKDGIEKQKTEKDILKEKLQQAEKASEEVVSDKRKKSSELQNLDAENWQLRQDLKQSEDNKQNLMSKLKDQQKNYDQLDKQQQEMKHENTKLKSRLNETESHNTSLSGDLTKLQSENARLKVLTGQKEKEILHLRDPDKDMVHQIRILSDEVTMLRTQTRRLNEEKGLLKSRSQKMESNLEESMKQKSKLLVERDTLFRENQDIKQRYRKLALANPKQRTLPDIGSGRNGPASRVPSRNVYNSAREEDEDGDYDR